MPIKCRLGSNLERRLCQQGRHIHQLRRTTLPQIIGMASDSLLIDIHTHVYLPRYASMLRERTSIPRIISVVNDDGFSEERLCILDREPSTGRPIGPQVRWSSAIFQMSLILISGSTGTGTRNFPSWTDMESIYLS